MKDSNYLDSVKEFHKTFSCPVLSEPTLIKQDRFQLRFGLIKEELYELLTAYEEKDIVGVADALGDLQYVLSGAILELGFGNNFAQIFDEIHRSNMSKECKNLTEAQETQEMYSDVKTYIKSSSNGTFLVFREEDDKVLKSKYYSPANLKQFIEDENKTD